MSYLCTGLQKAPYSDIDTGIVCASMRGNNCLYQLVSVVCIGHLKRETETRITYIQTMNKAALAYHFEYE